MLGCNNDDTLKSQPNPATTNNKSITLDQIATSLLKQNLILTALEFHTELAESGLEIPRLRDFFSNPANFEQQSQNYVASGSSSTSNGNYPLHKAPSIQTFDSLDLTRYSDDVEQCKFQDDKITVLEFELRKAKETINQLRKTLTLATETSKLYSNNDRLSTESSESSDKPDQKDSNTMKQIKQAPKNPFENDELSNDDDYDYLEVKSYDQQKSKSNSINYLNTLMPHDKNAINFLVNEYLLEQNFKMTSVTFSEENESQDLEDWDVVGLNRSKPPSICQLYKFYSNRKNDLDSINTNKENKSEKFSKAIAKNNEIGIQVDIECTSTASNTDLILSRNFECSVNFDQENFENQRLQISKLLEKQEVLIKSISNLEKEINSLTVERESNLKKIDLLSIALDNVILTSQATDDMEKLNESVKDIDLKNSNASKTNDIEVENENLTNLTERKIPVVFKDFLNSYCVTNFGPCNESINEEILKLKDTKECLVEVLFKYLPIIVPNISSEKRLELLPLVLIGAILEQQELSKASKLDKNKADCIILKLLFNLIEKPNLEQRSMILSSCIQFTKFVGPMYVNNYLLPLCWEQLNDKNEEKRMLVAEACAVLAPHIYSEMRSSLMFSILNQIIDQEKSELVRISAAKSLSILINYIKDERKFNQCIELLDLCATDACKTVVMHVEEIMLPFMSLWAIMIGKFHEPFIMHLVEKAEFYLLNKNQLKYKISKAEDEAQYLIFENNAKTYLNLIHLDLQFVFAYILLNFRAQPIMSTAASNELDQNDTTDHQMSDQLSNLNAYYHLLQSKLNIKNDLFKLDSILEDYLKLTKKYLNLIETDLWSTVELSNAFTWLTDIFIRKLIQMSAQVDAKDPLCTYFVRIFNDFVYLFRIDFELIKSKIIPIFEKLLNISVNESDSNQQEAIEKILNNKSCPLFKSTLPVYFVGILSALIDIELYGSINLNKDEASNQETKMFNTNLSNSSSPNLNKNGNGDSTPEFAIKSSATVEKRLNYMTNYLRNVFFTLSLNQSNLTGLIAIYEQMKLKSKFDYINQMLLATLWDGIVHNSLYVRCNTAKLFEILVKDCDEYLLSTRILPALITLANDLDKMVRCSSISPLTCIIECCNSKEILERVYTQLQSFLSDPIIKDEYVLQIELLKAFRRITLKSNVKFREEFILPYLVILALQVKNVINDNDYEFSQSSLAVSFASITSLNSSYLSSSVLSSQENQQHHQQDLLKICVLLFDIYQKIFSTNSENKLLYISRQSVQESLLPGLHCTRDIFLNNIINSNVHNEYVQQLDQFIYKSEMLHSTNSVSNSEHQKSQIAKAANSFSTSNSTPILNVQESPLSPHKAITSLSNATTALGDMVNANVSNLSVNGTTDNVHFKSFVFKGITNFKDHSKDKLSSFLLNNKMKK